MAVFFGPNFLPVYGVAMTWMTEAAFELHPQLKADTFLIASLATSQWLLMNDARFPWLIQVPRVPEARWLVDLPGAMRNQVRQESDLVVEVMRGMFQPDQMNVAQLGNVVSQLHIHHICRFKDDELWPKPVWAQTPAVPYRQAELRDRLTLIRSQF